MSFELCEISILVNWFSKALKFYCQSISWHAIYATPNTFLKRTIKINKGRHLGQTHNSHTAAVAEPGNAPVTPGDETNDPWYQQKGNKICLEKLVDASPRRRAGPVWRRIAVRGLGLRACTPGINDDRNRSNVLWGKGLNFICLGLCGSMFKWMVFLAECELDRKCNENATICVITIKK